ncbi:hypothetical protein ACL02O_19715 [Micromonospora sp. MS34]|uniref:hypothetical protein n=1 Tax=Micromonospora sp. MS34 TaxID=3385971 RepID=UPI00399F0D39
MAAAAQPGRRPRQHRDTVSYFNGRGSPRTGCTNPYPSAGEAAAVDSYFGFAVRSATTSQVFTDSWPAPATAGTLR